MHGTRRSLQCYCSLAPPRPSTCSRMKLETRWRKRMEFLGAMRTSRTTAFSKYSPGPGSRRGRPLTQHEKVCMHAFLLETQFCVNPVECSIPPSPCVTKPVQFHGIPPTSTNLPDIETDPYHPLYEILPLFSPKARVTK